MYEQAGNFKVVVERSTCWPRRCILQTVASYSGMHCVHCQWSDEGLPIHQRLAQELEREASTKNEATVLFGLGVLLERFA